MTWIRTANKTRGFKKQAVHFLLHGQQKTALQCYFNWRSVQLYDSTSVSSSTSSEYGSYAWKNLTGEQLEQPPRFLPTEALLHGALHVLLT